MAHSMYISKFVNKIICGDCLEIMSDMPDGSVDLVFMDPPYNAKKQYDNYSDNLSWDEYWQWVECFINEAKRISQNKLAVFVGNKLIKDYWDLMPDAHLICVRKGAIGTPFKVWFHQYFGLLVTKKPNHQIYDLWSDIKMPGEGYYFRETRYPNPGLTALALVERVVECFTLQGDMIFDPFMGTGTTAVAAKKHRRLFGGCEISPKYIAIAEERLAKTDAIQLPLITTPEQLNFSLD